MTKPIATEARGSKNNTIKRAKHYTGRQLPVPKKISEIAPNRSNVVHVSFSTHFTENHFLFLQGALHQFQRGLPLGFKVVRESATTIAFRRDMRRQPETVEQVELLLESLDLKVPKKKKVVLDHRAIEAAASNLIQFLYGL